MPIYEYRCDTCHKEFEEWQKQVDQDNTPHPCPHCNGQGWRFISNTSFALKGGGWYVTEYGNKKSVGESKAATPQASPSTDNSSAAPAASTPVAPAASTPSAAE